MNIPFLSKPAVKFYSECPVITDEYPIYPARNYKRKWVKNCATAFQKYKKVVDGRATTITAAKCPGVRNVMEAGYIATTWHDFTIETDGSNYEIFYPTTLQQFLDNINFKHPLITTFDTHVSPMKIPVGNNHSHIFKVFIPYSFDIPKGYELQIMPVQYDDDPKFTACYGQCEGFQSDFNIHIFWHETKGRITIPAGTPLCQLVPVKKDRIPLELHVADDNMLQKAKQRLFHKSNKFTL